METTIWGLGFRVLRCRLDAKGFRIKFLRIYVRSCHFLLGYQLQVGTVAINLGGLQTWGRNPRYG